MTGIDPFAGLAQTLQLPGSTVPAEPTEAIPQILQRRPSKAKRNRRWELQNKVTGYRGIPPELNKALKDIAAELSVSVSDVARAFLEYGLGAYKRRELVLAPRPRFSAHRNMTLYPQQNQSK